MGGRGVGLYGGEGGMKSSTCKYCRGHYCWCWGVGFGRVGVGKCRIPVVNEAAPLSYELGSGEGSS